VEQRKQIEREESQSKEGFLGAIQIIYDNLVQILFEIKSDVWE